MSHRELLALLLPPVSYAPNGAALQAELSAEGRTLDDTLANADRAKGGLTPFNAEQMLPDWERVCGITPSPGAGYQQRLQAVLAKLAETGGLSIPYFTRLAAGLGYQISIQEPQPFRAGESMASDTVWVAEIIWVWLAVVHGSASLAYQFKAGQAVAGDRLSSLGDPVLESVFRDLKPAHTFVYFDYQEH
ncbi:DUF2313 domain-containing protein [Neisseriaceae bacterium JH1-16]|nr:DUF2313 domain-containing protein [Neisseriaceae bacterium JH1-16]